MAQCPECEAMMDIDPDEVEEGELVSCPDCAAELAVISTNPLEFNLAEVDEDEDDDDDDLEEDEDDDEEDGDEEEDEDDDDDDDDDYDDDEKDPYASNDEEE